MSRRLRLVFLIGGVLWLQASTPATEGDSDGPVLGGEKGQGHVDFTIGGGDRGQGHVNFCVDESAEAASGGINGQEHVSFSVDPSAAHSVEACVLVGDAGAGVLLCAGDERGQSHVIFRLAVRADGSIELNGRKLATSDPADGCRISLGWRPDTGTATLQVADAGGVVCTAQCALSAMPDQVDVSAADIGSLAVARQ